MTYKGMLKEGTLNDKVIIVTGGGTGLGKSMSKYFLELGAKIIITSRKKEALLSAKKELEESTGGSVHCVPGDVRDIDDVKNTIQSSNKISIELVLINEQSINLSFVILKIFPIKSL